MVLSECMFLSPKEQVFTNTGLAGQKIIRQAGALSLAMVANYYGKGFNSVSLHRLLNSRKKTLQAIKQIATIVKAQHFDGVNIDFEEIKESLDEPLIEFAKALYQQLHPMGLMVTFDVVPFDEDYNLNELGKYCDYLFIMAYDQYDDTSKPGPISTFPWISKVIDSVTRIVPAPKLILCIAGYGYDWPAKGNAKTIAYDDAVKLAGKYKAPILYDQIGKNFHFTYKDDRRQMHQVYFTGSTTNSAAIRLAAQKGLSGTALWRFGLEDQTLWHFYDR